MRYLLLLSLALPGLAQSIDSRLYSEMHWRSIGPPRAGRARALAGVPSQPNVFYIGFDNGGVWRSTDFGSTWVPLFDKQSTGSIGAIAVAPSDPNIIYVGSGAGIIRPDLATGDGMYKSTDAGKTWTHLGLRDSQMIANIAVDPRNPNRLFVAVLGHPYGPNAERGIFRSTDGGATFSKVLYKDEYTSGNDVVLDPGNPNTVYAALWQQQQGFYRERLVRRNRRRDFQIDGWRIDLEAVDDRASVDQSGESRDRTEQSQGPLCNGCSRRAAGWRDTTCRTSSRSWGWRSRRTRRWGRGDRILQIERWGEHWILATDDPRIAEMGSQRHPPDTRPLGTNRRRRSADHHCRSEERERRV